MRIFMAPLPDDRAAFLLDYLVGSGLPDVRIASLDDLSVGTSDAVVVIDCADLDVGTCRVAALRKTHGGGGLRIVALIRGSGGEAAATVMEAGADAVAARDASAELLGAVIHSVWRRG